MLKSIDGSWICCLKLKLRNLRKNLELLASKTIFPSDAIFSKDYISNNGSQMFVSPCTYACFTLRNSVSDTAQKMKFSIKDFFSKYDQIRNICLHLLKKSLMENIFCTVSLTAMLLLVSENKFLHFFVLMFYNDMRLWLF